MSTAGTPGPMTVDEFYAFTDTRPDDEKWELIGGGPILNAAPSRLHQKIVKNVIFALENRARERPHGMCCQGLAFASPIPIGPSLTSSSLHLNLPRSILRNAMPAM
jgi:hypothetical protein